MVMAKPEFFRGTPAASTAFGKEIPCQGRITGTAGKPVYQDNQNNLTTLYWTPFYGESIGLYNGSTWDVITFTETSVSVPGTTDTNYDLFAYNNSGTLALTTAAWFNDTTRNDPIDYTDGIPLLISDKTRRYLGSFRTTASSGETEDSKTKRFVWNYYNRRQVIGFRPSFTSSWTSSGNGTWSAMDSGASEWRFDWIQGVNEDNMNARAYVGCGQGAQFAIALNGTNPNGQYTTIGGHNLSGIINCSCEYSNFIGIFGSYNYLQVVQTSYSGSSATFYGLNTTGSGTLGNNSGFVTVSWR